MSETALSGRDRGSDSTLVNAAIGAVATVVLGFVPLSPVLGGGIAGYLQGEDAGEALRVGTISGVFALVPLVLGLVLFGGFFTVMVPVGMNGGMMGLSFLFLLVVFVFGAVYTVGLSALGGYLGAYVRREVE